MLFSLPFPNPPPTPHKPHTMKNYRTIFHRDNSVTLWHVFLQQWVRLPARGISHAILATLPSYERTRICKLASK